MNWCQIRSLCLNSGVAVSPSMTVCMVLKHMQVFRYIDVHLHGMFSFYLVPCILHVCWLYWNALGLHFTFCKVDFEPEVPILCSTLLC